MNNVISEGVHRDLCCGCGICAGPCPSQALEMSCDEWEAQLVPYLIESCRENCQVCLDICPFAPQAPVQETYGSLPFVHEPGMINHPEVGQFLAGYVGFSRVPGHREAGASGGMATWLLEKLLQQGLVEAVITGGDCTPPQQERLFHYAIVTDVEEVRRAAKSKYYPVELSDPIRKILAEKEDRSYAVVALPCRAIGLRLAMAKNPKLRKRVCYIIGLVCGQLPTRFFTEFCATLGGIPYRDLLTVEYRHKSPNRNATNFTFVPYSSHGKGLPLTYHPTQYQLLRNYCFTHRSCLFCDDFFAESADVVLMDAWLSEFQQDHKSLSLVVVRDPELHQVLIDGKIQGCCQLEAIPSQRIAESQSGQVFRKKKLLAGRLWKAELQVITTPSRRTIKSQQIFKEYPNILTQQEIILLRSKEVWATCRQDGNT